MRSELYQLSLIFTGFIAAAMFAVFLYYEVYPEYRIYQNDYIALEEFRSSYTKEPPPLFKAEVKQIVIEREDRGPPIIDRCVSCHVALSFEHFSPTKIARDLNGNLVLDEEGNPEKVPNEEYVWGRLNQKIAELTDAKVIEQLRNEGNGGEAEARLKQAEDLERMKTANVGNSTYDVTKVLAMHPLIGKETRPFEFHPVEEYGCVSCHNGNGRALTTVKAHGPVFDGQYEVEFMGPKPEFLELDPKNDPAFARMFNDKPGSELLFQTTPLFIGALIEAKCVQCHQPSSAALQGSLQTASLITKHSEHRASAIQKAFENEKQSLAALLLIYNRIEKGGLAETIAALKQRAEDYTLAATEQDQASSQLKFLLKQSEKSKPQDAQQHILNVLEQNIVKMTGSAELAKELQESSIGIGKTKDLDPIIDKFVAKYRNVPAATGSLFAKAAAWNLEQEVRVHVADTESSLEQAVDNKNFLSAITSDIDFLTHNYQNGQQLYISQACYACHRIAGFARGGVGPELTRIGNSYPWYIKESIVWPQADLPTSTMPNFKMDHEEVQDLMAFLLAQKGESKAVSPAGYRASIQEWEAGKKNPWEKPISPALMQDVRYAMTVFATEGCAACHRLKGFESNVGFQIEKGGQPDFKALHKEKEWFEHLFPENITGTQLVAALEKQGAEVNERISSDIRSNSLLEEIDSSHPGQLEALYTSFKYALRAKNDEFNQQLAAATNPIERSKIQKEQEEWKVLVNRVLMIYIQEYGLGRLIGPRPNWSGIFRSDEWLMEHFRNPSAHVPRSIMPVFPFDDTKFYALTNMLDVLGIRNRNDVRALWEQDGFNPQLAFEIHCSQCHGEFLTGNGPVAEWIYPIPKNLRNADFLRNLTKERVIQSITHGVKGTPMPPWGEAISDKPAVEGIPVLKANEIARLADWLFSELPGEKVIRQPGDVPKWQYSPKDVLEELKQEGSRLKSEEKKAAANSSNPDRFTSEIALNMESREGVQINNGEEAEIFDILPPSVPGPDKYAYYIKKKYYTKENIEQGREFFELNCAVCHGKEADGSGIRSEVMQDAKPRMLTNLDWINTRDDLRLLRSIKYGVPGTAMTPWGDFTSSLQRLQLVMFIRTLTQERQRREELFSTLYRTFESAQLKIENARLNEYASLEKLQSEYQKVRTERNLLQSREDSQKAIKLYEQELELLGKLKQQQEVDQLFVDLKGLVKRELDLYQNLGLNILTKHVDEETWKSYLKLIALNENRYSIDKESTLQMHLDPSKNEELTALGKELVEALNRKIAAIEKEKTRVEGQLASAHRTETLTSLAAQISGFTKLRNLIISNLEEASRLRQQQTEIEKKEEESSSHR